MESVLQISKGRKCILTACISGGLVLQKQCGVSSSRWLNILVNVGIKILFQNII